MKKAKIDRPNQISLWLSEEEREKLEVLATKTHKSLSGTVRMLILQAKIPMGDVDVDLDPLDY